MDSLLKSDIFFFITSAVVVIIGILAVVTFYYLINILRDAKAVAKTVKEETKELAQDLSTMRTKAKSGQLLAGLFSFIKALFKRKKGRKN